MISWNIIQSAMELGLIYALVAMALFLSYSMLNVCDLSTDGCYTLGCAVGSIVAIAGHPVAAIFAAMLAGVLSGFITAFLQTKLGVESLLAGIIVNTGLYTINIMVMGRATISLNDTTTVFTIAKDLLSGTILEDYYKMIVAAIFVVIVLILLILFLGTRLGLSIRATGNNLDMVKSSSINPHSMIIIGLCISNAITALGGCLIGEYQKTADINMGTGMVTIALASLIIGETIFGKFGIGFRAFGVIVGACLYRVAVAIALRFNLPASALKLVSALIVAIALAYPAIKNWIALNKKKNAALHGGQLEILKNDVNVAIDSADTEYYINMVSGNANVNNEVVDMASGNANVNNEVVDMASGNANVNNEVVDMASGNANVNNEVVDMASGNAIENKVCDNEGGKD